MRISPEMVEVSEERADAEPGLGLLAAMAAELGALYERVEGSLDSAPATPAQMAPPGGAFLVLRTDGRPVACGGLKRLDPSVAEIKRMYVIPELRSRGVARLLLAALEDRAAGLGYRRVRLDTGPSQPEARSLYESAGYVAIPDYNGNPWAAYWFEKQLSDQRAGG